MSLKKTIEADIKQAMLAKEKDVLQALRAIKSLILLAETEKGGQEELSADVELKLLTKAAKQRRESAEIYAKQGRADLEAVEVKELEVIERYMPKQLSDDEIVAKLKEIMTRVGATSAADLGKVMGTATKELSGMADGKVISAKVKELLA